MQTPGQRLAKTAAQLAEAGARPGQRGGIETSIVNKPAITLSAGGRDLPLYPMQLAAEPIGERWSISDGNSMWSEKETAVIVWRDDSRVAVLVVWTRECAGEEPDERERLIVVRLEPRAMIWLWIERIGQTAWLVAGLIVLIAVIFATVHKTDRRDLNTGDKNNGD